jgi:tetratricopeptide (TPR) repeat protein
MAHDVFISYSNKDKTTADAICAALEVNGIRCWIAPRDILPGSDWGEAIIDAIHACRAMLLIFSSSSNTSAQIKREVERAVNAGIPVVPVRIEDVLPSKTLEYFISTQHWLDALTPPMEQHLQYLVTTMRTMLARKPDGSEASVREPQLKPPPAATAVTPPPAATAPAIAPAPAAGSPGRKFAWPVAIGLLVLAVAAATLAGVLWRRGDRPAAPPVTVKAPEKPPAANPVPTPAEPEDKTKVALDYAKQSQAAQDFQQKIALISKAIDLSPIAQDKSRFYEMRGEYYSQNQDYDKAIDDLSKALMLIRPYELLPKHEIYEKRGLAYREKGDLERARQDFQAALNDDYLKTRSDKYQAYLDKINEKLPAPTAATPTPSPVVPPVVTPPSPPPAPVTAPPGGYGTWPWTSQRLITDYDLQGLSLRDLELMRNEIYARHGWVFNRQDLRQYFESQSWYRPKGGLANREEANRLATAGMSGLERRNVQIIQAMENRIKR